MLTLKAPAKINWFLRVRGRRADGYHDIESLFQSISLCDELTFEDAESVSVVTEAPIAAAENLVMKAALILREVSGSTKGARISLVKNIPISAGLGGGSSDAATTLRGLNELWELNLPHEKLRELALALGSDVPFFLGGPSSMVGGRGEVISPANINRSYALLLLNPNAAVSAGWAYSELMSYSVEAPGFAMKFIAALEAGDLESLKQIAVNDLEAPVMKKHPAVGELRGKLLGAGALFLAMSGSGPTVFGAFPDRESAEAARKSIKAPWSAVAETLTKNPA
jgi:4-diphosphocytidyl-2-C-methyl-D-erythritol kinase